METTTSTTNEDLEMAGFEVMMEFCQPIDSDHEGSPFVGMSARDVEWFERRFDGWMTTGRRVELGGSERDLFAFVTVDAGFGLLIVTLSTSNGVEYETVRFGLSDLGLVMARGALNNLCS